MKMQMLIIALALLFTHFFVFSASALTIDSTEIIINDNGVGEIDLHYSLSLWDKILLIYYGIVGEDVSEKELIKLKLSEWLGKDVVVTDFDKHSGEITIIVSDFIDKKNDFKDSYWMSYTGIHPKEGIFKCSIENVLIIFPDGYVRAYDGIIPSDIHFVNENLTSYYYSSQYYQELYEKNHGIYNPINYQSEEILNIVGEMISEIGYYDFVLKAGVSSISVSVLPQNLQLIVTLKDTIETVTTGEPYKTVANLNDSGLMKQITTESGLIGYMGPDTTVADTHKIISDDMKKMSQLKSEEVVLLDRMLSETYEWNENNNLLIINLNSQRNTLIELIEVSNTMMNDVQSTDDNNLFITVSDDGVLYLKAISGLAIQISESDLKRVNEELKYLNSLNEFC